MVKLPEALVIVDPKKEHNAVREARRMGIPTIALIDTDSDPDEVDLPIPGNDDSIRSIEIIISKLADACLEGAAALPPEQRAMIKPRSSRASSVVPAATATSGNGNHSARDAASEPATATHSAPAPTA